MTTVAGDLLARARAGDKRSIARLLSVVENDEPGAADAMRALYPETGRAQVIGITGPPGGGKSTLVNRLAGSYRESSARVAVVAVDPSSPFSGGAILGDRIRMRDRFPGDGLPELVAAIAKHGAWSEESGERERRRREAARAEVESLLREELVRRLAGRVGADRLDAAVARVADRAIDPYAAVDELLRE